MTDKGEIYFCEICGNKVQVLEEGNGTLVCCGEDMILIK
jgi:superoxide reductase